MARLIVVAFSEDTIAAPGNRQPNYIEVSVTDVDGEPVTGLGVSNFKVDPMIVGPGGALVDIKTKANLTQERFNEINKTDVSLIPLDDALVMGDKDAKNRIIVFTDPD